MQATERDFQAEADEHGRSCAASCREELEALEHAQECDGTDENGEECQEGKDAECPEAWHDEDTARQRIEESPLSVEVRTGWYAPGGEPEVEEFCILLGTGGPASRIRGTLDGNKQPSSACFEFQDWFKPWTEARLSGADCDVLARWASVFYFGE